MDQPLYGSTGSDLVTSEGKDWGVSSVASGPETEMRHWHGDGPAAGGAGIVIVRVQVKTSLMNYGMR